MKIVFVYLGNEIPKYAVQNIVTFSNRFANLETWLVSDNTQTFNNFQGSNIRTWHCKNPLSYISPLIEFRNVDRDFRGGFWLLALARFYALEEFFQAHENEAIMQIECDVLILNTFPFNVVGKIKNDLAFPMINETEAVASVFYCRSKRAIENLNAFISTQLKTGINITDMNVLRLYSQTYPNRVEILPTNVNNFAGYQPWVSKLLIKELSSGVKIYKGIFDAATWGQYIGGEDPRNTLGIRRVFHVLKHHAVDPSRFNWFYESETESPYVSVGSRKVPIFCLHIHSKDSKFFSKNSGSRLQKRIDSLPRREKREFLLQIALTNFRITTLKIIFTVQLKRLKKLFGTS